MTIEYEGKAKQILSTDNPNIVIQRFKDSATAFNGETFAEFLGKGKLNNAISCSAFREVQEKGLATHFLNRESSNHMRVRRLRMIPLEAVVRNVVAGSLHKRTGLEVGTVLKQTIIETYDELERRLGVEV